EDRTRRRLSACAGIVVARRLYFAFLGVLLAIVAVTVGINFFFGRGPLGHPGPFLAGHVGRVLDHAEDLDRAVDEAHDALGVDLAVVDRGGAIVAAAGAPIDLPSLDQLRTPLARMKVALELIQPPDDAVRKRLADLGTEVDELDRMIADVLTASRLDLAELPLRKVRLNAGDLVRKSLGRALQLEPALD